MRVQNNTRTNFGCGYCKATQVLLENKGFQAVDTIIDAVNPASTFLFSSPALQKAGISTEKLHEMRAENLFNAFSIICKKNIKPDKKQPMAIYDIAKELVSNFDDILSIKIGNFK